MLNDMFVKGEYFPLVDHEGRLERYRRNEKLAKGEHFEVFKNSAAKNMLYVYANFAGLIARKSADYLVGEKPIISSGKSDGSNEQKFLDKLVNENNLYTVLYQQALQAAIKGDAFIKIRYGQQYGGMFPETFDKPRVIIEGIDAKKVYPQAHPMDSSKIVAYHIADVVQTDGAEHKYELVVESHYAGKIVYRRFELKPFKSNRYGEIVTYVIGDELPQYYDEVSTGVPVPLVVHIPNFSDGTTWEGIDDISEHIALFDEINNRLTQIASILDKHADPALAVPAGLLSEDEETGQTVFHVAVNKVFEVLGKDDIIPQYVTWDGKLEHAYKELELLVDYLLSTSEIPAVAVGLREAGTSGNSGLSIKWRMAGLLAKINRKRQFLEEGLKKALVIAQMLEISVKGGKVDFELVTPQIHFKDGLPQDETELANRMAIRTNGGQTLSRKTALMIMDGLTEEQAEAELKRIEEERKMFNSFADTTVFNDEGNDILTNLGVGKVDNRFDNYDKNE